MIFMVHIHSTSPSVYSKGFSLLELLLVLFIMGLMTATTMLMTGGVEDQAKYDETKRRMELIKRAIVGDTSRTVNGTAEISGFVADMGRLPSCLSELVALSGVGADKSPCDGTTTIQTWRIDTATGLYSGWRGPYLDVMPDGDGEKRFRDGYGNDDGTPDYGWEYDINASGVVSLASSGVASAPELLNQNEGWLGLGVNALRVKFVNKTGATLAALPQDFKLRFFYPGRSLDSGAIEYADTAAVSSVIAVDGLAANDERQIQMGFTSEIKVAMGMRGYVVLCADGKLYDATGCSADMTADDVVLYTILPNMQLPLELKWVVE